MAADLPPRRDVLDRPRAGRRRRRRWSSTARSWAGPSTTRPRPRRRSGTSSPRWTGSTWRASAAAPPTVPAGRRTSPSTTSRPSSTRSRPPAEPSPPGRPWPARAGPGPRSSTRRARSCGCGRPTAGWARRSSTPPAPGTSATCTPTTRPPAFYETVFGWEISDVWFATMIRVPGLRRPPGGDHRPGHPRAPGQRLRPAGVRGRDRLGRPRRGRRAAALARDLRGRRPGRDRGARRAARRRGAGHRGDEWARTATVRDPQGAVFTVSQFTPPE